MCVAVAHTQFGYREGSTRPWCRPPNEGWWDNSRLSLRATIKIDKNSFTDNKCQKNVIYGVSLSQVRQCQGRRGRRAARVFRLEPTQQVILLWGQQVILGDQGPTGHCDILGTFFLHFRTIVRTFFWHSGNIVGTLSDIVWTILRQF